MPKKILRLELSLLNGSRKEDKLSYGFVDTIDNKEIVLYQIKMSNNTIVFEDEIIAIQRQLDTANSNIYNKLSNLKFNNISSLNFEQ